jgi:hypothetical protein
MIRTKGGHNLRATVTTLVLAALLLALVFSRAPDVTAFSGAQHVVTPIHERGAVGTGLTKDPYIENHAALVTRQHDGNPR